MIGRRDPRDADLPPQEVLRTVLRHVAEVEEAAREVTDTVLDRLQYVDAGPALDTVDAIGAGLVDAFVALSESLDETYRMLASAQGLSPTHTVTISPAFDGRPPLVEIDLTAAERLERAAR